MKVNAIPPTAKGRNLMRILEADMITLAKQKNQIKMVIARESTF